MSQYKSHPFNQTLGPGPYRFVGAGRIAVSETFGARYVGPQCENGAGTCAHCGHLIMNIFVIETGEGRRFGVGSDCVGKVGIPAKELTALQKAERELNRQKRVERKKKKAEKSRAELGVILADPGAVSSLKSKPHHSPFQANKGLTLLDWASWCHKNSSDGGIVIVLNRVKREIGKK